MWLQRRFAQIIALDAYVRGAIVTFDLCFHTQRCYWQMLSVWKREICEGYCDWNTDYRAWSLMNGKGWCPSQKYLLGYTSTCRICVGRVWSVTPGKVGAAELCHWPIHPTGQSHSSVTPPFPGISPTPFGNRCLITNEQIWNIRVNKTRDGKCYSFAVGNFWVWNDEGNELTPNEVLPRVNSSSFTFGFS